MKCERVRSYVRFVVVQYIRTTRSVCPTYVRPAGNKRFDSFTHTFVHGFCDKYDLHNAQSTKTKKNSAKMLKHYIQQWSLA